MPRWGWAIVALALVIAGVLVGPFVYIHYVEGKPPAPLSVNIANPPATSATNSAGATPTTAGIDRTWKLASGSTAGYRVNETLLGQSQTATGRTTSLTGSLTVSGGTLTAGSFSADMRSVTSDRSQRDHQFQTRIMDTSSHPTATFKLTQPIDLGATPADGVTLTKQVTGDLTLHGTTKAVTFTARIEKSGSTVAVSGSIPVVFSEYNIPNPSFAGLVTTENHGILEFLLNFQPA